MTISSTVEKDMRQCEALCPKDGTRWRLSNFEQASYFMHGHLVDDKMCVWTNAKATARKSEPRSSPLEKPHSIAG